LKHRALQNRVFCIGTDLFKALYGAISVALNTCIKVYKTTAEAYL